MSAKPSNNSLLREIITGLLKQTTKVFVSIELIGGNCSSVTKTKVLSYIEYLGLYRTFIDSVDDSDLKKYHLIVTLNYLIDGISNSLSVVKMIAEADEE